MCAHGRGSRHVASSGGRPCRRRFLKGKNSVPKSLLGISVLLAAGILVAGCATGMSVVTLRYGFELEDRDGARFVQEDFAFRSGDRFRFVIASESSVYAYLFNRGTDEESYAQLYPRELGRARALPSDREVTIPPDSWYRLDAVAGVEQMVLVVATKPIAELDFGDERELEREGFDARLGDVERTYPPERFQRRIVDDNRVELTAEGLGDPVAVVVRISLQHRESPREGVQIRPNQRSYPTPTEGDKTQTGAMLAVVAWGDQ